LTFNTHKNTFSRNAHELLGDRKKKKAKEEEKKNKASPLFASK